MSFWSLFFIVFLLFYSLAQLWCALRAVAVGRTFLPHVVLGAVALAGAAVLIGV